MYIVVIWIADIKVPFSMLAFFPQHIGDASVVCSSPNLSSFQEGQRAASKRMTSEALTSSEG